MSHSAHSSLTDNLRQHASQGRFEAVESRELADVVADCGDIASAMIVHLSKAERPSHQFLE